MCMQIFIHGVVQVLLTGCESTSLSQFNAPPIRQYFHSIKSNGFGDQRTQVDAMEVQSKTIEAFLIVSTTGTGPFIVYCGY